MVRTAVKATSKGKSSITRNARNMVIDLCESSGGDVSDDDVPDADTFLKLEHAPASCADPEGECFDHTCEVIDRRLKRRQRSALKNIDRTICIIITCLLLFTYHSHYIILSILTR